MSSSSEKLKQHSEEDSGCYTLSIGTTRASANLITAKEATQDAYAVIKAILS